MLFVGQKVVGLPLAGHVVLAHQTVKRVLDLGLKHGLVHIYLINHKDRGVFEVRLYVVNITNEIEQFEHAYVIRLKALVVLCGACSAVNYLNDTMLKIFSNSVKEAPERNQCSYLLVLHCLYRLAKCREHGAFARRNVLSLKTMLTYGLHYVRQHLELIVHEGVARCIITRCGVANKITARAANKSKEVFEHRS